MHKKQTTAVTRREAIARIAWTATAAALPIPALVRANGGPVRLVIASTPGTGPDTMSRLMQPLLQSRWDRTVIVENKPGAGGVIGIDTVAKSAPDGATLMLQTSTMFLLPYFYKNIPFDPVKSFQPISQVGWSTFALVVNDSVPASDLPTLTRWLAAGGGKISYASPGNGTENHLFAELFKQQAGVEMMHVPYRGTANAIQDLIGNQVALMFLPIATANTHAKTGRLRIIGCTSKDRFPLLPQIPSLQEQGLAGFDFSVWYGVWGPAGMPANIVSQYNEGIRGVLARPDIVKQFGEQGWAVKSGSPQELDALGRQQYARWGEVIEQSKIDTGV